MKTVLITGASRGIGRALALAFGKQGFAVGVSHQKQGQIINIASIMALRGGFGNVNYAAAKAGLIALSKGAARELGRFNISVNAVLPGFHPTDMSAALGDEQQSKVLAEHALGH